MNSINSIASNFFSIIIPHKMASRSKIGKHLTYLLRLREANSSTTREMIRVMTAERMAALSELAQLILNGDVAVYEGDHSLFLENGRRRLRQLASPNISLARKRRLLLNKPMLVPRLLRERHLEFALLHFIRGSED